MISKAEIKRVRSLNTKKGRDLHNLILIEGKRLVEQIIKTEFSFTKIWVTEDFKNNNASLISDLRNDDFSIDLISEEDLKKIKVTQNCSGIIGIMNPPKGSVEKINQRIIILDSIADPGNLGTILRTANWFGIRNIILSEGCVNQYNPKVIRSAMGAHFSLNIVNTKIDAYIKKLQSKGFQIIAADLDTDNSIEDFKLDTNKWGLVMGSEAHGLSESVSDLINHKIKIPQIGKIESLNVSVACGIFLYHISTIK